ncbi:hypothetical protein L3X39_04590 [Sabulilitoribacter multivorans]|uniref:Lipoprotein n=1 Tax=Flaviramulus multivorans TaxID=1304750 RepID=A0ABS9IGL9_9FLAO|nr:hypothetical protein [Flaviramulus multivorans]MCF7559907.1 hypothetical protein [Flaviramulus multivorans]
MIINQERTLTTLLFTTIVLIFFGCKELKPESFSGKLFIYEKSNIEGSNKGLIAIYYKEYGHIESFKWHTGNNHATIVRAWVDTVSYNVNHFKVFKVDHLGNEHLSGSLDVTEEKSIHIKLGEHEQVFNYVPNTWHSYDFDFTSLSFAFQSLVEFPKSFTFNILDLDLQKSPPELKDFGKVEMNFLNEENKWSRDLLKYKIDGLGLDYKGGHIWFDKTERFVVGFIIEKPDEPGYESGKLMLKKVDNIQERDWKAFKIQALNTKQ